MTICFRNKINYSQVTGIRKQQKEPHGSLVYQFLILIQIFLLTFFYTCRSILSIFFHRTWTITHIFYISLHYFFIKTFRKLKVFFCFILTCFMGFFSKKYSLYPEKSLIYLRYALDFIIFPLDYQETWKRVVFNWLDEL